MMSVGRIDPRTLSDRLATHEPLLLLDVREPFERAIATIPVTPDALELTIPMREIHDRLDEIRTVAEGRQTVVYCHHGQRSMVAARWLAMRAVEGLHNLEGGIDAWSTSVDPATPRY
jgi:sulfur-carrier protein adenylyltransferase/sulfurtransferase